MKSSWFITSTNLNLIHGHLDACLCVCVRTSVCVCVCVSLCTCSVNEMYRREKYKLYQIEDWKQVHQLKSKLLWQVGFIEWERVVPWITPFLWGKGIGSGNWMKQRDFLTSEVLFWKVTNFYFTNLFFRLLAITL